MASLLGWVKLHTSRLKWLKLALYILSWASHTQCYNNQWNSYHFNCLRLYRYFSGTCMRHKKIYLWTHHIVHRHVIRNDNSINTLSQFFRSTIQTCMSSAHLPDCTLHKCEHYQRYFYPKYFSSSWILAVPFCQRTIW